MIRVEAKERRSPRLDWQTFSATHFPGRRRHDLEALIAYGGFRRSHETARSSDAPARIRERSGQTSSTGLEDWESEGGTAR